MHNAQGKVNLQNPARKESENLTIVPLPDAAANDVYEQSMQALNAHFHVQENAAYEQHVLRQLRQEPCGYNTLFVLIDVNIDTMNRRYQRLSLSRVSPFKSKQFKSTKLNSTQIKSNVSF